MAEFKCLIGLHNYKVYKEDKITDVRGNEVGKVIISTCENCGKVKVTRVRTVENY